MRRARASDISAACTGETDIACDTRSHDWIESARRRSVKKEKKTSVMAAGKSDRRRRVGGGALLAVVACAALAPAAFAAISVQDTTTGREQFELHGSGTTNPSKLFWWAMDQLEERALAPVRMTYRSVGSGVGTSDFVTNAAQAGDFASTDYGLASSSSAAFYQIPFQIGAVSLFVNLPGVTGSGQLKLTACAVIKIYTSNAVVYWDDAAIKAENPDISLPHEPIKLIYRSNGSSSTMGLKGYMDAAQAASCPYTAGVNGNNPNLGSSTPQFDTQYAVDGSDGMRQKIAANVYSLGYIDSGHGHKDDLAEVALKSRDGVWVVTKEGNPNGVTTAKVKESADGVTNYPRQSSNSSAIDFAGDWSAVNLFYKSGTAQSLNNIWPICAFTFMHLRVTYTGAPETAGLAYSFAEFILSDEVQKKVPDFDFLALEGAVKNQALTTLASAYPSPSVKWLNLETTAVSSTTAETMNTRRSFSKRRQAYIDYVVELQQKDIAALEATIAELQTKMTSMTIDNEHVDNTSRALAAVAFVVGVASLVMNLIACCRRR